MSKSTKTTKANAVFLATVLVAGIIALSYPSFMKDAQAFQIDDNYNSYQSDYGMDRYDDRKSYGKDNNYQSKDSVIVKKINKCSNVNVNLNGFNGIEIGTLPATLSGLATGEAQTADGSETSSSNAGRGGGSDGRSSGSNDGFVCIIKNTNNNGGSGDGNGGTPTEDECLDCFEDLLALNADVHADLLLAILDEDVPFVLGDFVFDTEAGATIADFCEALLAFVELNGDIELTAVATLELVLDIVTEITITNIDDVLDLLAFLLCLETAGFLDVDITAVINELLNIGT